MNDRMARIIIVLGVLIVALLAVVVVIVATSGDDDQSAQGPATTLSGPTSTLPATTQSPTTAPSGTQPPTTSTSVTSATTTSTTSTTSSTTTTSTTTTTTVAVACPGPGAGALPGGATVAVEAPGDFDGDGVIDRFLVYEVGGTHTARVELAYGFSAEAGAYGPGVIDARSANLGSPSDLAIAVSTTTPASRMATFYSVSGCVVEEIPLAGGGTARFPLESGFMGKAGVTCDADGLTVSRAAVGGDMSGDEWEVSGTVYLWVPGLGELQAVSSSIALIPFAGNETSIEGAAVFGC